MTPSTPESLPLSLSRVCVCVCLCVCVCACLCVCASEFAPCFPSGLDVDDGAYVLSDEGLGLGSKQHEKLNMTDTHALSHA